MVVDDMNCFHSIFILTIIIRFILLINVVNKVVVVNSFYPSTIISSRKIIHGLYKKGKLLDTIVVENDQTYNKNNMIMDLMKQNNNIMFQSLVGPFLIQSECRNNNQNDTNEDVYQIQYTFIPLESIDDHNHDANTEYITSTASAICAWNSLQKNYMIPNESTTSTTSDRTTTTTTTVLLASWTPSLFLFKIEELVPENNNQHHKINLLENNIELIKVVSRILIQHTLWLWYNNNKNRQLQDQVIEWNPSSSTYENNNNNITIQFVNETSIQLQIPLSNLFCNNNHRNNDIYTTFVRSLFNTLSKDTSTSELVEMIGIKHNKENNDNIDTTKYEYSVVGVVPRTFVHQYNLLHRGIGVIVTKNKPILLDNMLHPNQPDIYCHQRTSTKRIFPSLYDMFIGGVSLVDELSCNTALREVSEELGIITIPNNLISSQPLFQCIICTTYNRCIVDVYGYTMNSNSDSIQWQEDEVAWGAFVPYSIVETAATLSIQRLQQENKWPGRYNLDMITNQSTMNNVSSVDIDTSIGDQWKHWDFVPDGLLVWESWLHFLKNKKE